MKEKEIHYLTFNLPSFQSITKKGECYYFVYSSKISTSMEDTTACIFRRMDEDITAGVWNATEMDPDDFSI